ncbi:MAG: radical SAM/SPASM domain-containing protein [Haliangiales bacterium]
MSFEGKLRLNVLQESPLDQSPCQTEEPDEAETLEHWVPSRYNVRATTDDGRLILWNSMSHKISVFKPEQSPYVLPLLKAKGFESRKQGLAGYLIDRGYLVRKGTNEYRQFLFRFGRQHYRSDRLELILMSSEDCNFRCRYCYEDFARGTMLPKVRQGVKELVKQRIESLSSFNVSWFGGEPLYGWAAVEELAPFFVELTDEHDVLYQSHMTTNGYLLTPDVADKLLSWKINDFQITLDGMPESHDCNRPTRDGQGTFWTIVENLKAMSKRDDEFSVSLRINFDKANYGGLEKFLELVKVELGGDSRFLVNFHPVGRWGGANDDKLEICGGNEKHTIAAELRAAAHKHGLRFHTLKDINHIGSQVCYAARPYNFLIGASGKVMKCTVALDKDPRNVVGQLAEDGNLKIDGEYMSLWTVPSFQTDSQCQKCVVLPACQGISCPLPRLDETGRPCIPSRTRAKAQLVELLDYSGQGGRSRRVGAPQAPASDADQASAKAQS